MKFSDCRVGAKVRVKRCVPYFGDWSGKICELSEDRVLVVSGFDLRRVDFHPNDLVAECAKPPTPKPPAHQPKFVVGDWVVKPTWTRPARVAAVNGTSYIFDSCGSLDSKFFDCDAVKVTTLPSEGFAAFFAPRFKFGDKVCSKPRGTTVGIVTKCVGRRVWLVFESAIVVPPVEYDAADWAPCS